MTLDQIALVLIAIPVIVCLWVLAITAAILLWKAFRNNDFK